MGRVQSPNLHPVRDKGLFDLVDRLERPGKHHAPRAVHGGKRHPVRQVALDLRLAQGHAEHGARGQFLHQPASLHHDAQGVLEAENARQRGGHVLTDRVPDHGRR